MNVVRLALSAGSLTLAVAGVFVLVDAPSAHAEDCTGLLGCATKNVGDTVEKVGKGDLKGTAEQTGKTVGDTVGGVRKTVGGSTGDGDPPPSDEGGSGGGGSSGGGHDSPGASDPKPDPKPKPKPGSTPKHRGGADAHGPTDELVGAGDTSLWVSLQQWQGPRLPLGGLRSGSTSTTTAAQRQVPPPEVAPPPITPDRPPRQQQRQPRYLTAVPAADAHSPEQPQPLPAGTVFAATALTSTVGIAVLGAYQQRRRRAR